MGIQQNETVDRFMRAFTMQRDTLALFDEQLCRWGLEQQLTQGQPADILRLKQQMAKPHQINARSEHVFAQAASPKERKTRTDARLALRA
jgi:hypothetical protein